VRHGFESGERRKVNGLVNSRKKGNLIQAKAKKKVKMTRIGRLNSNF